MLHRGVWLQATPQGRSGKHEDLGCRAFREDARWNHHRDQDAEGITIVAGMGMCVDRYDTESQHRHEALMGDLWLVALHGISSIC